MSEQDLLKYIKSYLIRGNSFVIPGIGELSASYRSARIDQDKKSMLPPSQELSFNPGKKKSEGRLAIYIHQKTGIKQEETEKELTELGNKISQKLEKDNMFYLEGLGMLRKKDTKLEFKQDDKEILASASYGMSSVRYIEEIGKEKKENSTDQSGTASGQAANQQGSKTAGGKKSASASPKQTQTAKKTSQKKRQPKATAKKPVKSNKWVMPLVIVLVVLLVFAGGAFTLIKTGVIGTGQQSENSWIVKVRNFNPFEAKEAKSGSPEQQSQQQAENNKQETQKPESKQQKPAKSETEKEKPKENKDNKEKKNFEEPERKSSSEDLFYLIAGSYKNFDNAYTKAEEYVDKGFDAEVFKSDNGNFRVSISAYNYRSMAVKEMQRLRDKENLDTWVLQK